jgi:hypothetical protein
MLHIPQLRTALEAMSIAATDLDPCEQAQMTEDRSAFSGSTEFGDVFV